MRRYLVAWPVDQPDATITSNRRAQPWPRPSSTLSVNSSSLRAKVHQVVRDEPTGGIVAVEHCGRPPVARGTPSRLLGVSPHCACITAASVAGIRACAEGAVGCTPPPPTRPSGPRSPPAPDPRSSEPSRPGVAGSPQAPHRRVRVSKPKVSGSSASNAANAAEVRSAAPCRSASNVVVFRRRDHAQSPLPDPLGTDATRAPLPVATSGPRPPAYACAPGGLGSLDVMQNHARPFSISACRQVG